MNTEQMRALADSYSMPGWMWRDARLALREAADRIDALEGALRRAHEWLERVEDNPGYMGLDHPVGANPDCSMCALLVAAAAVNPTDSGDATP